MGIVEKGIGALSRVAAEAPALRKTASAAKEIPPILSPSAPQPSLGALSRAFETAIARHTALTLEERMLSAQDAEARVAEYMGREKNGRVKPLLTQNVKLMKADQGYNLDGVNPLKLDTGEGVETTGLALSPALRVGKFNTCPNSESCKGACLGKTAGNYYQLGGGQDMEAMLGPRLSSYNRTRAFLNDPEAFAVHLHEELNAAREAAAQNGNRLGVRLNVLSDIHPKVYKSLMDANPEVGFYDYTKNINAAPVADNHQLTYSSTGVSQPASVTGLAKDVENPHSNWHQLRKKIDAGHNVTMSFSNKLHMPESVLDQETGVAYPVLNGDMHDFRPIDGQAPDGRGWIVGLKNKAANSSHANAVEGSGGFFIHYDPKIPMENGKQVRNPDGTPVIGNKQVVIAPQPRKNIFMDNDGKHLNINELGEVEQLPPLPE